MKLENELTILRKDRSGAGHAADVQILLLDEIRVQLCNIVAALEALRP